MKGRNKKVDSNASLTALDIKLAVTAIAAIAIALI